MICEVELEDGLEENGELIDCDDHRETSSVSKNMIDKEIRKT